MIRKIRNFFAIRLLSAFDVLLIVAAVVVALASIVAGFPICCRRFRPEQVTDRGSFGVELDMPGPRYA